LLFADGDHRADRRQPFRQLVETHDELAARCLQGVGDAVAGWRETDGDHVRLGVEGYWAHVKHPWFVAFFEIAVAARTDKELAAILFPAQEAFEREWYETSLELFPEWKRKGEKFLLGFDLSRYVMEGMAISFLTHKETERDKRVLRYLEEKLKELVGEDR